MKRYSKLHAARAQKAAIDSYPGGLCFSTPGGLPILVNARMNDLIFTLTGHILLECNETWADMKTGQTKCQLLQNTGLLQILPAEAGKENLFFQFPDQTVWHFQRLLLKEAGAIQLTAIDITTLYRMSIELYQNNQQLVSMYERQRTLLENIVHINRDRELLAAKMRIHDELGECLLRTQKAQQEGTLDQEHSQIAEMWLDTLQNLNSFPEAHTADSTEAELLGVAQMVGCQIQFLGPRPAGCNAMQLLYAAVREALMNAVCHAKADQLTVQTEEQEMAYHIRISDNGGQAISQIQEGVGLTGLRRRLEQDGASMRVECGRGVTLILDIPKECEVT